MIICGAGYYGCPLGNDHHWHCTICGAISGMMGHYKGKDANNRVIYECPENSQRYVHVSKVTRGHDADGNPIQLTAEEEDGPYEN